MQAPHSFLRTIAFVFTATVVCIGAIDARADGLPQATIKAEDLDPAAFGGWLLDRQQEGELAKDGPKAAIWTRNSRPELRGVTFGESSTPGPRHLRIGLKAPTPVGSVIVRGGGQ